MPRGEYSLIGPDGDRTGSETFTSAPGPAGWRYYATRADTAGTARIDVSVDAGGRPVRVRLEAGEHELLIVRRGDELQGLHDGAPVDVPAAGGFLFPSPGLDAVLLHARDTTGDTHVVAIDAATLAPSLATIRLERGDDAAIETAAGTFDARAWRIGGRAAWIAGALAVAGDGYTLAAYEPGASGPAPR